MRTLAFTTLITLLTVPVYAGTLRLGEPVVNNNEYRFPVYLQGDAEGVAALDFRLSYDPAVFSPVSAQSGPSAASAQKQVSSNVAAPGEFVVVMMGFNQNAVGTGQVVEIIMEKVSDPSAGHSVLRIDEPTLATSDGNPIRSRGLARTVEFDHNKGDGDAGDTDEHEPPAAEDDVSVGTERDGEPSEPATARPPRGSVPFVIAGRNSDGSAISGRMPVTGGAPPGTGGQPYPAGSASGAVGGAAAPGLPPGTSESPEEALPGAMAARPNAGESSLSAGEVDPATIEVAQPEDRVAAVHVGGPDETQEAGNDGASGESPLGVFGVLLLLGLAPVAAFVVYKVLLR